MAERGLFTGSQAWQEYVELEKNPKAEIVFGAGAVLSGLVQGNDYKKAILSKAYPPAGPERAHAERNRRQELLLGGSRKSTLYIGAAAVRYEHGDALVDPDAHVESLGKLLEAAERGNIRLGLIEGRNLPPDGNTILLHSPEADAYFTEANGVLVLAKKGYEDAQGIYDQGVKSFERFERDALGHEDSIETVRSYLDAVVSV